MTSRTGRSGGLYFYLRPLELFSSAGIGELRKGCSARAARDDARRPRS